MSWLYSFIAGRWLVLTAAVAVLGVLLGAYGLGRSHANTRWEARWEARDAGDAKALAEAKGRLEAVIERQARDFAESEREYAHAEARNAILADSVARLNGRLRVYTRRAGPVPAAATCAAPADGPAGPAFDAGRTAEALADFAAEWARIRDREAAQLSALQRLAD